MDTESGKTDPLEFSAELVQCFQLAALKIPIFFLSGIPSVVVHQLLPNSNINNNYMIMDQEL